MVKITDKQVNKWIKNFKKKLIKNFEPEKIILFGSRARGDNLIESDIDLIIISKKFEELSWPKRLEKVSELWDGFITLEPLCYTPKEFKIKTKQLGIVHQAIKEGKEL